MKRLWMFKVENWKIVLSWQAMQIIVNNWEEHHIEPIGPCCQLHHEFCERCNYKCKIIKDEEGIKWNVINGSDYVKHIHKILNKEKPG